MTEIDRRRFLASLGDAGAALAAGRCSTRLATRKSPADQGARSFSSLACVLTSIAGCWALSSNISAVQSTPVSMSPTHAWPTRRDSTATSCAR
jgi:hypothetical protein